MAKTVTWLDRLQTILDEKDISRRALSKAIGRHPTYLTKMRENQKGNVSQPSWPVVQAICRVLEVSPSELMGDEGESDAA